MNETNRDLIWFIGVLTLINFFLEHVQYFSENMVLISASWGYRLHNSIKIARVLVGNTTHSTIVAISNVNNRRDSSVSMGTGMEQ